VRPQDILDRCRVRAARHAPVVTSTSAGRELIGDPGGLGPLLQLADVLLASPAVHRDDRNEPAARHEPDEQQPPLEFGHVAGRIGRVAERTLARE
jgi:hypothetical protein